MGVCECLALKWYVHRIKWYRQNIHSHTVDDNRNFFNSSIHVDTSVSDAKRIAS